MWMLKSNVAAPLRALVQQSVLLSANTDDSLSIDNMPNERATYRLTAPDMYARSVDVLIADSGVDVLSASLSMLIVDRSHALMEGVAIDVSVVGVDASESSGRYR